MTLKEQALQDFQIKKIKLYKNILIILNKQRKIYHKMTKIYKKLQIYF